MHKYGLFSYFDSWFSDSVFLTYSQWKSIVKTKIREYEVNTWKNFVIAHPSYKLAETCLDLVSLQMFWSISNQYPDLVTHLHVQIRLMSNFGLSACVPWTIRTDESLCFVCKEAKDDFLFVCSYFCKNFDSLWSNLDVKASNSCPTDGSQISAFIKNLDQDSKVLLLLGCLLIPFDSMTVTIITCSSHRQLAKSTSCALKYYLSLRLCGFVNSLFLKILLYFIMIVIFMHF